MKYPGYEYKFEIGQQAFVVSYDKDHGNVVEIIGYSYYPEGVYYETRRETGMKGFWFWKEPVYKLRGFRGDQLAYIPPKPIPAANPPGGTRM